MSLIENDVADVAVYGDWLERCCERFVEHLGARGYASGTIRIYGRVVRALCAEASARRLDIRRLGVTAVASLNELAPRNWVASRSRQLWKSIVNRFIGYLVETGAIDPSTLKEPPQPGDRARLRGEYEDWLCHQRGLSRETVKNNLQVFDAFMRFRFGDDTIRPDAIRPKDLLDFLAPKAAGPWTCPDRSNASRLRNLLRFLHWSGRIRLNLAETVSRTARRRSSKPRMHLEPDAIQRVIDGVQGDSALARRNRAMLLLTARLGLRAREVVAIRLKDIRWRAGEILIRGKGRLHDPMPLPVDVGEALVEYIRCGRQGASRHLFVTARAPWRPFQTGEIIARVLKDAMARAGCRLPSGQTCGAHLFRHSLATALLRQGASFHEIGDVLRHRHSAATMIYARYDIDALRSLVQPWPVLQGGRS